MKVRLDRDLLRQLEGIKRKDPKLARKVEKQLVVFSGNPKHVSLRTHKLSGKLNNLYSISITKSIRMTYILLGEEAYFTKIGTHNEVYKNH